MATERDGGPAFPQHPERCLNDAMEIVELPGHPGATLRDYFAAKAMAALIVDPERVDQSRKEAARLSYMMADAMLAARSLPPQGETTEGGRDVDA